MHFYMKYFGKYQSEGCNADGVLPTRRMARPIKEFKDRILYNGYSKASYGNEHDQKAEHKLQSKKTPKI